MNKTEHDACDIIGSGETGFERSGLPQSEREPSDPVGYGTGRDTGHTRLKLAVRQAKTANADRCDSIADMHESEIARLELLIEDLQPVFDAVPVQDEQWDFCLSSGFPPRLWLDATAFVMIARDKRSYRFVRDTRLGRVVLGESAQVKVIAVAVVNYIAQRMVERERLLQGDLMTLRQTGDTAPPTHEAGSELPVSQQAAALAAQPLTDRTGGFIAGLTWFLIGALLGCTVLALLLQAFAGFKLF